MKKHIIVSGLLSILISLSRAQQCDVNGQCIGEFIGGLYSEDSYNCLATCKNTSGCLWFTANEREGVCGLFSSCDELDQVGCPLCISGEVTCALPQCNRPGQCQGTFTGQTEVNDHRECQESCATFENCTHYTYVYTEPAPHCYFFDDCDTTSDDLCPKCVTGQPGCDINQFLMVVGGVPTSSFVEVISLDGQNNPLPECLTSMNNFPDTYRDGGAAALLPGGIPTICGGQLGGNASSLCHTYRAEFDLWYEVGSMPEPRYNLASDYGYFDTDWRFILAGGFDDNDTIRNTVETTKDGANFASISPMPVGRVRHCLVIAEDDTFFVLGGETDAGISADVYQYSSYYGWQVMNSLSTPRRYPNCGKVKGGPSSDETEIVVAGGANLVENFDSVEIFNVGTQQWRMAVHHMPVALRAAVRITMGNSFILVGGHIPAEGMISTIFEYDPDNEDWKLLPAKLGDGGKDQMAAMMVDTVVFKQCE